jgi:hypothetical protein
MATQLRDYRITDGSLDQFVDEWRRHLAPLRRELGFAISGAWTVEGESRFVWLLTFPGDWDAFEEADQRYFASPERAAVDPDPARLIDRQVVARLDEVGMD